MTSPSNIHPIEHISGNLLGMTNKASRFAIIMRSVKNWPEILQFWFFGKTPLTMHMRDGTTVRVATKDQFLDYWRSSAGTKAILSSMRRNEVVFKGEKIEFVFHKKKLSLVAGQGINLIETFFEEQYKSLTVKGKDVVDIGASIGDTAVYFAMKNSKRVIAIEPFPYSYEIAKNNVKRNGVSRKVTLLNAAVGDKKGIITIDTQYKNRGSEKLKNFTKGIKVPIVTLKDIVTTYQVEKNASLKIDCEGHEYSILLNTDNETLAHFKEILLEYHYGYKNIKKKLECAGFVVKKLGLPRKDMLVGYLGILHAIRKT